ncbi:DNA-binding transcriptional regulator, XRE family [Kandleria vitulina]|uniref:helix-turn-helix domain-containing protein n=1 Tax=Kandleria vitulina TaxID=1630 RepID=UPI0008D1B9BF|nr:helix-turn-helix transcriptional regulator [Kandleria vitulina]SEI92665.1 DNA-binding transcriptional regulator, XRE family [Kandleria vitulina]
MAISYKGLWKLLIDNNMNKTDLMNEVKISSSTIAKMSKGEPVSMLVLERICEKLDCDFGDIISIDKKKQ